MRFSVCRSPIHEPFLHPMLVGICSGQYARPVLVEFIFGLTRAGVAAGVDALFIETHPDCDGALCDAASMLPLQKLEELLKQAKAIDELIKPHLPYDEVGIYDYKEYEQKIKSLKK